MKPYLKHEEGDKVWWLLSIIQHSEGWGLKIASSSYFASLHPPPQLCRETLSLKKNLIQFEKVRVVDPACLTLSDFIRDWTDTCTVSASCHVTLFATIGTLPSQRQSPLPEAVLGLWIISTRANKPLLHKVTQPQHCIAIAQTDWYKWPPLPFRSPWLQLRIYVTKTRVLLGVQEKQMFAKALLLFCMYYTISYVLLLS